MLALDTWWYLVVYYTYDLEKLQFTPRAAAKSTPTIYAAYMPKEGNETMTRQTLAAAVSETCDTAIIRGFQIEIDQTGPATTYRDAHRAEWNDGYYINTHVEFGASPIRDKKSMDEYLRRIASHGLQFTVYAII